MDRLLYKIKRLRLDSHHWLYLEVSGKLLIQYCLLPIKQSWVPGGTKIVLEWQKLPAYLYDECSYILPGEMRSFTDVTLSVFIYRLFHEDFFSLIRTKSKRFD